MAAGRGQLDWFLFGGVVNRGFTVIQNMRHPLSDTELFFLNLICVLYYGKMVQKLVST